MSHFLPKTVLAVTLGGFGASSCLAEEVNNGTNPTILSSVAAVQYKHSNFRDGSSTGLFEAIYSQPLGERGNMALGLTVPYASGLRDSDYDLGDLSVKFTHVLNVDKDGGSAYTAEVFADTAGRAELGAGHTWLKASGFYAFFFPASILAPSLVQQVSLDSPGNRARINNTTFDLYYVPKLADPKYYVTYDPALVHDWENEESYASLTITFGRMLGKVFGGDSQVYIKPQVLGGKDRPIDFTVQVGYKVIGF